MIKTVTIMIVANKLASKNTQKGHPNDKFRSKRPMKDKEKNKEKSSFEKNKSL